MSHRGGVRRTAARVGAAGPVGAAVALFLAAVTGLTATGCGRPGRSPSAAHVTVHVTASEADRTVESEPWKVQDAWMQADGRTLKVSAPVPVGARGCSDGLIAQRQAEDERGVWVQLTFSSLWSMQGRCPAERVDTATVTLPTALGGRILTIDHDDHWVLEHGVLRRCGDQGCHPVVVPAACTSASYVQAGSQLTDLPRHSMVSTVGCDGTWLVVEVWFPGGHVCGDGVACTGGAAAGRWVMRASPQGWHVVLASRSAGCTDIRTRLPEFPQRLCTSLKAL